MHSLPDSQPGVRSTGERRPEEATDGTVTDGPYPETKEHLGGFAVADPAV